ncbi:hypothetical protein D3C71_1412620 [compost metagenome]
MRPRPPEVKLMIDWPIIAQPAKQPNRPQTALPAPWAMLSRLPLPFLPPISSSTVMVSSDSISPTSAITTAYGNTTFSISRVKGAIGRLKCGNAPEMSAKSPTRSVCRLNPIARADTTISAASDAGMTRVNRGKNTTTRIARATSPYISSPCPAIICSCASIMTIASPFTKP